MFSGFFLMGRRAAYIRNAQLVKFVLNIGRWPHLLEILCEEAETGKDLEVLQLNSFVLPKLVQENMMLMDATVYFIIRIPSETFPIDAV